jgi:hypothetical protein
MIADFYFETKNLKWSPNRNKKERNSVSNLRDFLTHQYLRIYLVFNLFNR